MCVQENDSVLVHSECKSPKVKAEEARMDFKYLWNTCVPSLLFLNESAKRAALFTFALCTFKVLKAGDEWVKKSSRRLERHADNSG